jgi:hypothetical protein
MMEYNKPGSCIKEILCRLRKHKKKMGAEYKDEWGAPHGENEYGEMIKIVEDFQAELRKYSAKK